MCTEMLNGFWLDVFLFLSQIASCRWFAWASVSAMARCRASAVCSFQRKQDHASESKLCSPRAVVDRWTHVDHDLQSSDCTLVYQNSLVRPHSAHPPGELAASHHDEKSQSAVAWVRQRQTWVHCQSAHFWFSKNWEGCLCRLTLENCR